MTNRERIEAIVDEVLEESRAKDGNAGCDFYCLLKRELPKLVMPRIRYDEAKKILIKMRNNVHVDDIFSMDEWVERYLKLLGFTPEGE